MSEPSLIFVTSTSRPKRIAFLFNPEKTTSDQIDALIGFSQGCWGGRYFPLIPTDGKTIAADWWKLLAMVDPDYIHSLEPLSEVLVEQLNRRILPAIISEVSEKRSKVVPDIDALGVGDIIEFSNARQPLVSWRENMFLYFKDSHEPSPHKTFFVRNFGLLPGTIGMEARFKGVRHLLIEEKGITPEGFILQVLSKAEQMNAIFPIQLCRMFAWPNFDVTDNSFGNLRKRSVRRGAPLQGANEWEGFGPRALPAATVGLGLWPVQRTGVHYF